MNIQKATAATVKVWRCQCVRCGHAWTSTGRALPNRCASCKSRYWNRARVRRPYRKSTAA